MPNPLTGLTLIPKITESSVDNSHISPSANIDAAKFGINTDAIEQNTFNSGVIGFKIAVNEGLTIFNLVDGVVDEFNSEAGIDTSENSNAVYNSSSDFYSNLTPNQPIPSPQIQRTSFTSTGSFGRL